MTDIFLSGIEVLLRKSSIDLSSPCSLILSFSVADVLVLILSPIVIYFSRLNKLIKNFLRFVSVALRKSNKSVDD